MDNWFSYKELFLLGTWIWFLVLKIRLCAMCYFYNFKGCDVWLDQLLQYSIVLECNLWNMECCMLLASCGFRLTVSCFYIMDFLRLILCWLEYD